MLFSTSGIFTTTTPLPVAVGPVLGLVLQPRCLGQPQEYVVSDDSQTGRALVQQADQLKSLRRCSTLPRTRTSRPLIERIAR